MEKQKKPGKKNPQVHGQAKTCIWVAGSKNSKQMFLVAIVDVTIPEFMFGDAARSRLRAGKDPIFVMMGTELSGVSRPSVNKELVTEHYIKLKTNWRGMSNDEKVQDAKMKKTMLTGNVDFPIPWSPEFITLTQLGTDITDADAKLLARSQKLPNSAQNLKVAVKLIYDDCKNIGTMVQLKMDAAVPDEAIRICTAAGYTYKAIVVRGPRKNRVRATTEPGVVQVEGEGAGDRLWQFSLNPQVGEEIKDLPSTYGGVMDYNVGKSKVEAFFRWRLMLRRRGYGDWSPWYSGMTP